MQPVLQGYTTADSGGGSTAVDATLTSAGSTRLVGQVTVANPTTSVSLSSGITVSVTNPTTSVSLSSQHTVTADLSSVGSTRLAGRVTVDNPTTSVTLSSEPTVIQGAGSTSVAPWYVISTAAAGAGSTTVDANLTSAGSTKLVGQVTVANPTTAVTVSSGVVLGAGSTANMIGTVTLSTINQNVDLSSAGSTRVVGLVDGITFSTGMTVFTTLNSSVDVSLLAASTARKGCIIQNGSTGTALLVNLSTQAVSSAGSYNFQIPANGFIVMGGQVGNMPNFTGPMRCKTYSTAVSGTVFVTAFNSS